MNNNHLVNLIKRDPIHAVSIAAHFQKTAAMLKKGKRVQYQAWIGALLFVISSEGLYKLFKDNQGKHFGTFEEFLTHFCEANESCRAQATNLKSIHQLYFALKRHGHRPGSIDLLVVLTRISNNDDEAVKIYEKEAALLSRHTKKGKLKKLTAALLRREYQNKDSSKSGAKSAALATAVTQSVNSSVPIPLPIPQPNHPNEANIARDKDIALQLKTAALNNNWSGVVDCIRLLDPDLDVLPIVQVEVCDLPPKTVNAESSGNSAVEISHVSDVTGKIENDTQIDTAKAPDAVEPQGPVSPLPNSGTVEIDIPTAHSPAPACQSENPPCEFKSLSDWQEFRVVELGNGAKANIYLDKNPNKPLVKLEIHHPFLLADHGGLMTLLEGDHMRLVNVSVPSKDGAPVWTYTGKMSQTGTIISELERFTRGEHVKTFNL